MTLLVEVCPATSAAAVDATLNWAVTHRQRLLADVLILMRGLNLEAAAAIDQARERAVPVDVLRLPALDDHTALDPNGQVAGNVRGEVVLWLEAGVVPDAVDAVIAAALELHRPGRREVGAVGGAVHPLRLQTQPAAEPEAFPGVFARGGVLLRWAAVQSVGGLSRLLMPGEAAWADLAWRMRRNGRRVLRSDGLTFTRAHGRPGDYTGSDAARLRDSLIVTQRHLPRRFRAVYRSELLQAARLQAALHPATAEPAEGQIRLAEGLDQARRWANWERVRGPRTLSPAALERVFNRTQLRREVAAWCERHPAVQRVALAGLGWQSHALMRAAQRAGLDVVAVGLPGLTPAAADTIAAIGYRGLPVVPMAGLTDAPRRVHGVLAVGRTRRSAERLKLQVARHFRGPVFNAASGRLSRAHAEVVVTAAQWPGPAPTSTPPRPSAV